MALNLGSPWYVSDVRFESVKSGKELHIDIDFTKGFRPD